MKPPRPLPSSSPARAGAILLAVAALALGACRSAGAKAWNLRQVHEWDGSPSRVGRLHTDWQHILLQGTKIAGYTGGDIFGLEDPKEKPIEDPHGVSLENLVELGEFDPDDPRIRALQVEMFSWLGVDDDYALARERALLELGPVAKELGVTSPIRPPEDPAPADARAVGEGLKVLVDAMAPASSVGGMVSEAAVEEACAGIEALVLDRDGLRRLVNAINVLLYESRADPARLGVVVDLHETLQRELVGQSLGLALGDENPWVRAAAIEACVVASDNGLGELLWAAVQRDPIAMREEAVVLRCLHLLAAHGFPKTPEDLSAEEREAIEERWIQLLVELLRNPFEGNVTIAACRALETLSGGAHQTLRPEVWIAWYEEM